TGCQDCKDPFWFSPDKNIITTPPENIVAVVVDVREDDGAIFIHEVQSGTFVDGVGTEESRNLVVVPWNSGWDYYCIGSLRLAYVGKKS
ncbi:MAG: hypothetical protein M4579_007014, partial [Chaenotheca gracillima]